MNAYRKFQPSATEAELKSGLIDSHLGVCFWRGISREWAAL